MSIPEEAIAAAHEAYDSNIGVHGEPTAISAAVHAAAPLIAAQALIDAADITPVAWDFGPGVSAVQIRPWLRKLANQMKAGK